MSQLPLFISNLLLDFQSRAPAGGCPQGRLPGCGRIARGAVTVATRNRARNYSRKVRTPRSGTHPGAEDWRLRARGSAQWAVDSRRAGLQSRRARRAFRPCRDGTRDGAEAPSQTAPLKRRPTTVTRQRQAAGTRGAGLRAPTQSEVYASRRRASTLHTA